MASFKPVDILHGEMFSMSKKYINAWYSCFLLEIVKPQPSIHLFVMITSHTGSMLKVSVVLLWMFDRMFVFLFRCVITSS